MSLEAPQAKLLHSCHHYRHHYDYKVSCWREKCGGDVPRSFLHAHLLNISFIHNFGEGENKLCFVDQQTLEGNMDYFS